MHVHIYRPTQSNEPHVAYVINSLHLLHVTM